MPCDAILTCFLGMTDLLDIECWAKMLHQFSLTYLHDICLLHFCLQVGLY